MAPAYSRLAAGVPIEITVKDCSGQDVCGFSPIVSVTKADTTADTSTPEPVLEAVATNGKDMTWDGRPVRLRAVHQGNQFTGAAMGEGTYRATVTDGRIMNNATQKFDLKK